MKEYLIYILPGVYVIGLAASFFSALKFSIAHYRGYQPGGYPQLPWKQILFWFPHVPTIVKVLRTPGRVIEKRVSERFWGKDD